MLDLQQISQLFFYDNQRPVKKKMMAHTFTALNTSYGKL